MARPTGYRERRVLMDAPRLERTLARMAQEILACHPETRDMLVVGVHTRGVPLARRLAHLMGQGRSGNVPLVGALDITLYRDDLTTVAAQPVIKGTEIPCSLDDRTVILTDDVLFTGRTVRAALDELVDYGRPQGIRLAVLVDRGHRELPIQADYVGETVTTSRDEAVQVLLEEEDGEDRVVLLGPARPSNTDPEVSAPDAGGPRRP